MITCAIIGAGNGGQTLAAILKDMGYTVRMWVYDSLILDGLQAREFIEVSGALSLRTKPDMISGDISEVINGADIIMVAVPAFVHRSIAESIASQVTPDQVVVLNPGRTAGALEFRETLRRIADSQTHQHALLPPTRRRGEAQRTAFTDIQKSDIRSDDTHDGIGERGGYSPPGSGPAQYRVDRITRGVLLALLLRYKREHRIVPGEDGSGASGGGSCVRGRRTEHHAMA
jgi:hypothetical protein